MVEDSRHHIARRGGELRGASFVAVFALFAAAFYQHRFFGPPEMVNLADYLPGVVFLTCVIMSYGRFTKAALLVWLLLSAIAVIAMFYQSSWGDSMADGPENARRVYFSYGYLSDWLFASGASILLAMSLVLVATEWNRQAR
jgi:hypothetical protein